MKNHIVAAVLGVVAAIVALTLSIFAAHADGMTIEQAAYVQRPLTCYVKAFGSGQFINHDVTVAVLDLPLSAKSAGVGGQVGCDYSTNKFLIGVFGDYTWHKATASVNAVGIPLLQHSFSNERSIGGRFGVWANSATLLYGLAAYTMADNNASLVNGLIPIDFNSPRGVAVGGGFEVSLSKNINLTLEYRHTAYDTNTGTVLGVLPVSVDTTVDTVRTAIGYRF